VVLKRSANHTWVNGRYMSSTCPTFEIDDKQIMLLPLQPSTFPKRSLTGICDILFIVIGHIANVLNVSVCGVLAFNTCWNATLSQSKPSSFEQHHMQLAKVGQSEYM